MSGSTLVGIGSLPLATGITGASRLPINADGATNVLDQATLFSILDSLFGTLQGTVIYRGPGASGSGTWSGLAPGTSGYFLSTGGSAANPAWAAASSYPTGTPQGYQFWQPGTYTASQTLYEGQLFFALNFAANMGGIAWSADVAATANATLTLSNAGTQFGTVVFPASSTVGTVTSGTLTPAAANSLLACAAPATPDATLAGVRGRFLGTRP